MTNTSILTLDSVTFTLPDGRQLFTDLNESFDQRRTGLIGRNGVCKSVLAHILAGRLLPSAGRCRAFGRIHYLSQRCRCPEAHTGRQLYTGRFRYGGRVLERARAPGATTIPRGP